MAALGLSCPAAVENYESSFRCGACKRKKILPVASDYDGFGTDSVVPDVHIVGAHAQNLGYQRDFVTCLLEAAGHLNGHVLVNQESHSSRCAVCADTSGSISLR